MFILVTKTNLLFTFLEGEVLTFRFNSFLSENYTSNATILRHPENDEIVRDIQSSIIDMISQANVRDHS